MKTSIIILLCLIPSVVVADEVMKGYLIKQEDGSLKGCFVSSPTEAVCWEMYGSPLRCVPTSKDSPNLVCDVTEI